MRGRSSNFTLQTYQLSASIENIDQDRGKSKGGIGVVQQNVGPAVQLSVIPEHSKRESNPRYVFI
jgi:hypothetical protein